jgi:hypothetical protein
VITFYDEKHVPSVTMDLPADTSILRLKAEGGSAELPFNQEEMARITLRDKTDGVIWSAP